MGAQNDPIGAQLIVETNVDVTLSHDFLIQATEVTLEQTLSLGWDPPQHAGDMALVPCDAGDCPRVDMTWWDAAALANQLSASHSPSLQQCYELHGCTGKPGQGLICTAFTMPVERVYDCEGFRLPTEAEWEYAVRAGTDTPTYNGTWAMVPPYATGCWRQAELEEIAWTCSGSPDRVHGVGQLEPNAWGLYDMIGNVSEWTHSPYDSDGPNVDAATDPSGGPHLAPLRVTRGGSVWSVTGYLRASAKQPLSWELPLSGPSGVRLVRSLFD